MAAGDIVSGITIYSGGGFLTFQAAAGVEVAITHVTSHSGWLGSVSYTHLTLPTIYSV